MTDRHEVELVGVRLFDRVGRVGTIERQGSDNLAKSMGDTTDAGESVTCTAHSAGEESSVTVTILKDSTPPAVSLVTPHEEWATYVVAQQVLAEWSVSDTIPGSALSTSRGTESNGDPLDTATVGDKDFTVEATDGAGFMTTVTHQYKVISPVQALATCIGQVQRLGLPRGITTSLVKKCENASKDLDGAAVTREHEETELAPSRETGDEAKPWTDQDEENQRLRRAARDHQAARGREEIPFTKPTLRGLRLGRIPTRNRDTSGRGGEQEKGQIIMHHWRIELRSRSIWGLRCVALLLAGLAMATAADPALAASPKEYNVAKMRYENKGGYTAKVYAVFKHTKGSKTMRCKVERGPRDSAVVAADEAVTYRMNTNGPWQADSGNPSACPDSPNAGAEVWLQIHIVNGDVESCRKNGARYFYSANGGTVRYVTKGTTLNNNRCRNDSPAESYRIDN